MTSWRPDITFHQKTNGDYNGVRYVIEALSDFDIGNTKRIVTSREPGMKEVMQKLKRKNMPEGIDKWQLPIIIGGERPAFLFLTSCRPNAEVPEHIHPDDTITRVVINGSVVISGVELTHGDWFFVPKGIPYSYCVGPYGAAILHIYNGNDGDNDCYPGGNRLAKP